MTSHGPIPSRLATAGLMLALLAGCATEPAAPRTVVAHDCSGVEAPTGSNIVRRDRCFPITEEERDAQRRQAEEMREGQRRLEMPRPSGGQN